MNIKPTGHHVLIEPDEFEEVSEGGIVLTTDQDALAREQAATTRGTIIAVGETAWRDFGDKPWAKVGDYVYYTRHVSKTITGQDGKDYFLLTDDNILAIIEEA